MCQTAANLVEHVLPPVPLRQCLAGVGIDPGSSSYFAEREGFLAVLGVASRRLRSSELGFTRVAMFVVGASCV